MDGWMVRWLIFKKFIEFFCFEKLGVRSKKSFKTWLKKNLDHIFINKEEN
jgi:heme oxygenase